MIIEKRPSNAEESRMQLREYIMNKYLSDTIRRYYDEYDLTLSDSLLAAIMYHQAPMDEMRDIFLKLAPVTPDRKLSVELYERCDYIDLVINAVKSDEEGCIFRLDLYDNDGNAVTPNGVYSDYGAAEAVGRRSGHDFKITKAFIFGTFDEARYAVGLRGIVGDECGYAYYKQYETGARLWTCQDYSKESDDAAINEIGRFELDHVGIRHPFRRGSLVRMKDGRFGVISEPVDDDDMEREIANRAKTGTFSDEVIRVNYIYDRFKFGFTYCNVYELETAAEEDIPEDERIGLRSLRNTIVGRSKKPENETTERWVG